MRAARVSSVGPFSAPERRESRLLCGIRRGQGEPEGAATPGCALHAHLPAQFLDDHPHDGEPQAMASGPSIPNPEGSEEPGLLLRRDPRPVIFHPEPERAVRKAIGPQNHPGRPPAVSQGIAQVIRPQYLFSVSG
jgi:hypothetical protein